MPTVPTFAPVRKSLSAVRTSTLRAEDVRLGSGRSATVYRSEHSEAGAVARKVFGSRGLARALQLACLGAPNPYMWSGDAIAAARLRREVLSDLVRVWFGDRLRVAAPVDVRFNEARRTYELDLELIRGRHARLLHGAARRGAAELGECRRLLAELSDRLGESGFVGARWQAGHGNPTATANFMREEDASGRARWVWLDLESGIPMGVPVRPLLYLRSYATWMVRHRRPLFDDVDPAGLGRYLRRHRSGLEAVLGREGLRDLVRRARRMVRHQEAWRGMAWIDRGITYALGRGHVTVDQAFLLREKPARWYRFQLERAAAKITRTALTLPVRALSRLRRIRIGAALVAVGSFLTSQRVREDVARSFIDRRITSWRDRLQLGTAEEWSLRRALAAPSASAYVADFGVHVALKPALKVLQFTILPLGLALGWFGPGAAAVAFTLMGPTTRTVYTLARIFQCSIAGRERPWVALGVGVVPVFGNFAFPLQIIASSRDGGDDVARFILHDAGASLGRRVPIVGGPDTLAEHLGNRAADVLLRGVDRLPGRRGA